MRLVRSFGFAMKGLKAALMEQPNLRIHILIAIIVIVLGFYFGVTPVEWVLLLILIGLVISAELFNTALENLTDLVTSDYHPLAGKAKDIAAAAVLVLSTVSAVEGFIIFAKYV
jgi:diacylglycerol kinase